MNTALDARDDSRIELDRLAEQATDLIRRARAAGASQAEVAASVETGLNLNVRLGAVETVERTRDRGFTLTVYFGQHKGSASTADLKPESIAATLAQACAIARYTEADPAAGLADAALMAGAVPDLDLWHPWALEVDAAVALGQRIEDAGRALAGISNSEGATVSSSAQIGVYANSHGFVGRERETQHSLSCVLIAGSGESMQRDYWWDAARAAPDLMAPEAIGRKAAERTLARLGARRLGTRQCPVLFAPEAARSLLGHLVSAVSGGALYRRASFLLDHAGKAIFPAHVHLTEHPQLRRGPASAAFDAEGVTTREQPLVRAGVLERYVLGSYSARKLGLTTTGNAGGVRNLAISPGTQDFDALVRDMGRGLVVTELMGQGASTITGDYSRGASGFWVEDGVIAHPVEEITIASNLREMFMGIEAVGADLDHRGGLITGSLLVGRMTLAGD